MLNELIPWCAAAVTPNDNAAQPGYALYVGGTGNVTLITEGGEAVQFTSVAAGTLIQLRFVKVMATGTTATLMIRLGVVPFKPINTVAPAVTGATTSGALLTSTSGTWIGQATITFAYQWYRNGVAIAGATVNTYTIVALSGDKIICVVTATNPLGVVQANSNQITVT